MAHLYYTAVGTPTELHPSYLFNSPNSVPLFQPILKSSYPILSRGTGVGWVWSILISNQSPTGYNIIPTNLKYIMIQFHTILRSLNLFMSLLYAKPLAYILVLCSPYIIIYSEKYFSGKLTVLDLVIGSSISSWPL